MMNEHTQLEPPDIHYLHAAQGWLGLGDYFAANEELEHIRPEWSAHPDVLETRFAIYADADRWDACLEIGQAIALLAPDRESGWYFSAQALYRLKRYQDAATLLSPVVKKFPGSAYLKYNLACFHCLLGRITEARTILNEACALGGQEMKLQAMQNPDLDPVWKAGKQESLSG